MLTTCLHETLFELKLVWNFTFVINVTYTNIIYIVILCPLSKVLFCFPFCVQNLSQFAKFEHFHRCFLDVWSILLFFVFMYLYFNWVTTLKLGVFIFCLFVTDFTPSVMPVILVNLYCLIYFGYKHNLYQCFIIAQTYYY